MKKLLPTILLGLAVLFAPMMSSAARTDALWDYIQGGNYTKPNGSPSGTNILIYGSDKYINFNTVTGTNGYGFRDNAGTMQWKNSGGAWADIAAGGAGSQTPWGSDIDGAGYTLSNAYLTATATTLDLTGVTNSLVYANGIGRLISIATTSLGLPTFSDLSSYLSLSSWYATTTDGLDEGLLNKYFSDSLVDTWFSTKPLGLFWSTTSADHWYTVQSKASSTLLSDANTWSGPNQFAELTFTNATGTNLVADTLCLTGDSCITTWPTSGGGSGVGTIATSSAETANEVPFYTSTNGYPALLGTDMTFTFDSALQLLSVTNLTASNAVRALSILDLTGVSGMDLDAGTVNLYTPTGGYISIVDSGTGYRTSLSASTLTGNWVVNLPDADGTLALLSDISGATASSTLLADFNLFSGDNTFTGTSTIQKIYGMAGNQVGPLGAVSSDYSLLLYGGVASSTVAGGSKHGNSIQMEGGYPEGTEEDIDGNLWSPNCTIGDGCYGGGVNIYGGYGIHQSGGDVVIYGGASTSTVSNSGGGLNMGGGQGHNASNGGYFDMSGGQANGTGDGGDFNLSGGSANAGGNGGNFQMNGGYSALGDGGYFTLTGGEGDLSGGEVLIKGGQGNSGQGGSMFLRGGWGNTGIGGVVVQDYSAEDLVVFSTTTSGTNYFYNPIAMLSTASSTFANGIDLTDGCFSIGGVCMGTMALSGSVGQVNYYSGVNTAVGTSSLFIATSENIGVASSTPWAKLSVANATQGTFPLFSVASSTSNYFTIAANGNIGIGTTTPWGRLSIIDTAYDRQPGIVMATSTTDYPFWGTTASTSDALGDPVRMLVGWGTRFLTNFDTFAQLSVNGEINTHNTIALKCEGEGMKKNVQKITDTSGSVLSVTTGTACGDFSYIEDNGATFDFVATALGNYIRLRTGATAATTAAGDGAGIALTTAGLTTATNTPLKLEVSARPVTNVATSTLYVIGFTNTTGVNPNYAVMPTDGCGFVASTTQANWRIFCGKASAYTYVDSGIASTTNITTPANGAFTRFRVEMGKTYATFRYLRGSVGDANSWVTIGSISTNYPNTALLNPTAFVASIPIKSSDELQVRFIRAWYNDPEPY